MAKYIKKDIVDSETGATSSAWIAKELVVNVITGGAYVKEGGWADGMALATGKKESIHPKLWKEPNIDAILTTNDYPAGTKLSDIVFTEIATRMLSMPTMPNGEPNPFYGGSLEWVPGTSSSSSSTSSSSTSKSSSLPSSSSSTSS